MRSAKKIFESLEELGDEVLEKVREKAFSPTCSKTLKSWGIKQASELVNRSDTYIRDQEKKGNIPKPKKMGSKGREYTLEEINYMRDCFGTRPKKNDEYEPAIITFANFKGGSGKTTTAVHAAQYLALQGYRVLFIDCDSQASATQMFGFSPDESIDNNATLLPILMQEMDNIKNVIIKTCWETLDLIPANLALYGAEFALPARTATARARGEKFEFHNILSANLEQIYDDYDVIVLDPPPSMGMISINATYAANAFLIPIPPSMLDFASTIQFFAMVKEVLASLPEKEYAFIRLLITKHDNQDSNNSLVDTIRSLYGNFVMRNMMFTSEAVRKTAGSVRTLYEIDKYEGTKSTLDRALSHMNSVNGELEKLVKAIIGSNQSEPKNIIQTEMEVLEDV